MKKWVLELDEIKKIDEGLKKCLCCFTYKPYTKTAGGVRTFVCQECIEAGREIDPAVTARVKAALVANNVIKRLGNTKDYLYDEVDKKNQFEKAPTVKEFIKQLAACDPDSKILVRHTCADEGTWLNEPDWSGSMYEYENKPVIIID